MNTGMEFHTKKVKLLVVLAEERKITKVTRIHPLRTMNVNIKFQGSPSDVWVFESILY